MKEEDEVQGEEIGTGTTFEEIDMGNYRLILYVHMLCYVD